MFQDGLERHQIIKSFVDKNSFSKTYINVEFYAIVRYIELAFLM